jgi:hypothetical protein
MSLKGSLKDFQLEEIIKFIDAGKKTGALEVKKGNETVVFFFKNGGLYFVQRSNSPVSISEKILSAGILDEAAVKDIKAGKIFPPASLALNQEQKQKIKEIMLEQLVEKAADVFTWDDGLFQFKNGEKRSGEDWGVTVESSRFFEKVRKHSEVIKKFAEHAKTLKTRLYFNRNISPDEDVIISGKEWKFLSYLKDGMSVEQIIKAAGVSLFTGISIATSLLEKGLLTTFEAEEKIDTQEKIEEEVVERIKDEAIKESTNAIETPELEPEDLFDSENLINELAAITGSRVQAPDDKTREELENILKTLKNL